MTAAVYSNGTPSLAVPQTQNTAPVLEFNCLYTHDVRRKQKRWQDGFLRFHTFNKKIMVYDVPRNLIGHAHWKADGDLQDGDEVTLESNGVMVEVADCVGTTHTDLTELRKSAKKGAGESGSSSPIRTRQPPTPSVTVRRLSTNAPQLKHRSLNALLGTPKGPIGKAALPTRSPFEERQEGNENDAWEAGRPSKRQRVQPPPTWNVTRMTAASGPAPKASAPRWGRTSDSVQRSGKTQPEAGQQKLRTKEIVDLCSDPHDEDDFFSELSDDLLAVPSSPPKPQDVARKIVPVRSSSPAFQKQPTLGPATRRQSPNTVKHTVGDTFSKRRTSQSSETRPTRAATPRARGQHPAKHANVQQTVLRKQMSRSRLSEKSLPDHDQISESDIDRQNTRKSSSVKRRLMENLDSNDERQEPSRQARASTSQTGKTLRMTASAPRKKILLCQEQLPKKPARVHSAGTESAINSLLGATSGDVVPGGAGARGERRQLQERLARIAQKDRSIGKPDRLLDITDLDFDVEDSPLHEHPPTIPEQGPNPQDLVPAQRVSAPADNEQSIEHVPPEALGTTSSRQPPLLESAITNLPNPKVRLGRPPGMPVHFKRPSAKKSQSPDTSERGPPVQRQQEASIRMIAGETAPSRTKKPLVRAASLNNTSNGSSTVTLGRQSLASNNISPPPRRATSASASLAGPRAAIPIAKATIADPWSREAFDLFTWRPPGWDEEAWCVKAGS